MGSEMCIRDSYTTMAGCEAAVEALKHQDDLQVYSVQELHAKLH